MSAAADLRELLYAWPCRVSDIAAWWDVPPQTLSATMQGLRRGGYVEDLAHTQAHRGQAGIYALTAKGQAKVLSEVLACEICGRRPTVGVRAFATSDPVTTRVVCQTHLEDRWNH